MAVYNGICVAPETCTCYPDYVQNSEGICVKNVPMAVENGICNFDNTCRCNAGYFPDSTGKTCHPKCDKICSNGFCSGPNRCSCKAGFVKDVNELI
ncbi:hypothetical protein PVAND_005152 [Polypedilum vanderplanki]|uniref:EGF-like domain-containing protein n=1 Tax=Polypedilum vanderplanki TaxID=319348 RepID=A0A9J6C173_POLVA|nr:hypothetical protein PVAND_005152 [Polypedilum vanderplanki]